MAAFVNWTDPLLLQVDQAYAGENWKDCRSVWHPLTDVTLNDGGVGGQWYRDAGPKGMDAGLLEPRAFCTKGGASFSFTATTLIVRLNIAFSWYESAVVKIDGVAPSTLGLLTAKDTLDCNAAHYAGFTGDGYVDVIVADGLTYDLHTCTITVNSPDGSKFFSMVGFKEGLIYAPVDVIRDDQWLVPFDVMVPRNIIGVTIENRNAELFDVFFDFSNVVDDTGAPITSAYFASWPHGSTFTQNVMYQFGGDELSGDYPAPIGVVAYYPDSAGTDTRFSEHDIPAGSPSLTVTGTWFVDSSTPTGQTRQFTTGFTSTDLAFTFTDDRLDITFQTSAGWGAMGVYAANNTTLLHTINCDVDTGGELDTASYTGFGVGSHTVHLRKTTNDGKFIVFVNAASFVPVLCTPVFEPINLIMRAKQPVAMPVLNVALVGKDVVTFDDPIPNTTDYYAESGPIRENIDMSYTETMKRFPTFAVCYQSGFRDTLASYDRLIIDPIGAHAADVIYWQSLGIEVYGYIASSEEVGFYANRYDFSSALAPAGGNSPGGYATYYMYTKTPNGLPDQNGVFASYFTNPTPGKGWLERVENFYMPQVIGGPQVITDELVTTKTATISAGTRVVFDSAHAPLDIDEPMTLYTSDFCSSTGGVGVFTSVGGWTTVSLLGETRWSTTSFAANINITTVGDAVAVTYQGIPGGGVMGIYATDNTTLIGTIDCGVDTHGAYVTSPSFNGLGAGPHTVYFRKLVNDSKPIYWVKVFWTGSHLYAQYQDYTFDPKTGAVVITPGVTPTVVSGQHLMFSYTRKGHHCDGVFWDVVDNADTYSSTEFGFQYVPRYGIDLADFINQVKANHPTCKFISNRGFTILPLIIHSMAGVMFESWLTSPDNILDLANTDYHIITDPASIAYNDSVVEQLKQLRNTNQFDVYSLNYCLDGSDGDTLRNYCRQRDAEQGYMSWQSRITLDVPEEIIYVDTPGYPVETNAFVQCAIKFMGAE